ncbi:hypothetical protein AK812_SmicGene22949 [Symbiodinium microadriaticum]|uniref:Uncharacterized protein n=1 Tax=Symbiodinium microadriaticum TaxID=2951 RepID=A0A1Q9DIK1_SYMMI|nr:hypothetical protein AK812_SmicGene22949 [Symbiodinium microadriaticum]
MTRPKVSKDRKSKTQLYVIIATFYLAWVCCGVYLIWLMRSVLHGYRRMFREFSLGRRYHGQDLVRAVGPSVFHAQWATYTCGALIGNAAMALVLFMFVLWLLFLVLSLPQFWEAQWALRNWWILYGRARSLIRGAGMFAPGYRSVLFR